MSSAIAARGCFGRAASCSAVMSSAIACGCTTTITTRLVFAMSSAVCGDALVPC
jgi:hypothetical protein